MKKLYTKFPLILLTLLNYAPYTHTTKNEIVEQIDNAITNAETDAQTLVNRFINAEIPENFDRFFGDHFSAEMMENRNLQDVHSLLSLSQLPLSSSIQNSTDSFSPEEFEKQLPAMFELKEKSIVEIISADKKYRRDIPLTSLISLGCNTVLKATINPEHNILFIHFKNNQFSDMSYIGLINTRTLFSTVIPCISENEIQELGLNSDCSQLGIMRTDDALLSYTLPTDLINFVPTLKQRAFISYVDAQIALLNEKVMQSEFGNNPIKMCSRLPLDIVERLATFIETNKTILPDTLHNSLCNEKINSLRQILVINKNATLIANTLNIDIDTVADQIASNEITQEQIVAILSPEQADSDNQ